MRIVCALTVSMLLAEAITGVICDISNSSNSITTKTKRGIFSLGYNGFHPGLTYNLPTSPVFGYGLPKPWVVSPYAKFPGLIKGLAPVPNLLQPPQYALTPGDAVVTSYNVNYPRFPILPQKPVLFSASVPRPLIPTPTVVIPQKPIIPVAVPSFTNQVPFTIAKPLPPTYSFIPSLPTAPTVPIQPHFVSLPLPVPPPTVSAVQPLPFPGPTFITNSQPESWRPIIVTGSPSGPPSLFTRPSISLLPPYGSNDQRSAQLELLNNHFPPNDVPPLNQLYHTPEDSNTAAVHQHHLSDHDFVQDNRLQQHQHDLSQGQIDNSFNEQSFHHQTASNQGSYSGPSSYEVRINSETTNY